MADQLLSVAREAREVLRSRVMTGTEEADELVSTTSRLFRRRTVTAQATRRGRPLKRKWKTSVFLLHKNVESLRDGSNIGFGPPKDRDCVKIDRSWSVQQLEDFVISLYPDHPLRLVGFRFGKCKKGAGQKIILLNPSCINELAKEIRSGRLFIVPCRQLPMDLPVSENNCECPENQDTLSSDHDSSSSSSEDSLPALGTQPELMDDMLENVSEPVQTSRPEDPPAATEHRTETAFTASRPEDPPAATEHRTETASTQSRRRLTLRRAALRCRQTITNYATTVQRRGAQSELEISEPHLVNSAPGDSSTGTDFIEILDDEDEELQQILDASAIESLVTPTASEKSLVDLLKEMKSKINMYDTQEIVIFRRDVLGSCFRALRRPSFDVKAKLYVKFSGEMGVDHGGPRRELFRLAYRDMSTVLFEGRENNRLFSYDVARLEKNHYRLGGQLVGMGIMQDGSGPGYLNKELFLLMCGADVCLENFDLLLLPDGEVRDKIQQLKDVVTEQDRDRFLSQNGEWMIDQGFRDVWRMRIPDIPKVVHSLVKQVIFYRPASAIEQFCQGLDSVGGLMGYIRKYQDTWSSLFVNTAKPLNKEDFLALCEIQWSSKGSNRRIREEETIYSFELFLQEIQDQSVPVTFEDLLAFITGTDRIPPGGFENDIEVQFFENDGDGVKRLPFVSTCALYLSLPRGSNPEDLSSALIRSLKESHGFEKC